MTYGPRMTERVEQRNANATQVDVFQAPSQIHIERRPNRVDEEATYQSQLIATHGLQIHFDLMKLESEKFNRYLEFLTKGVDEKTKQILQHNRVLMS